MGVSGALPKQRHSPQRYKDHKGRTKKFKRDERQSRCCLSCSGCLPCASFVALCVFVVSAFWAKLVCSVPNGRRQRASLSVAARARYAERGPVISSATRPMPHLLFVTGKLAEPALRRTVAEVASRAGFEYSIAVLPITVVALASTGWIARHLQPPAGI